MTVVCTGAQRRGTDVERKGMREIFLDSMLLELNLEAGLIDDLRKGYSKKRDKVSGVLVNAQKSVSWKKKSLIYSVSPISMV